MWFTQSAQRLRSPAPSFPELQATVPRWVDDALGPDPSEVDVGPQVRAIASESLALLTATISRVPELSARELRKEVFRVYQRLESALAALQRQPLRFWNYIPAITCTMGEGLDRYMVFNAGRYDALALAHRDGLSPVRPLATASAVGIGGTDLIVHCLASTIPGIPVENPRQTSSWRYSSRYGPMPPCFSRATIATLGERTALLIGGTASVVGEQSRHPNDAEAQLRETLRNISAVVSAARTPAESGARPLDRLTELRAYAVDDDVAHFTRETLAIRCPRATRLEIVCARVCRPELLLELEGVADLE
jgi:chorismate lyase/3-hydroxybenzoate synthase